jgi:2-methylfumaryl-CoA hydratase
LNKTYPGRFFEGCRLGETIFHTGPRTLSGGEKALYHALYPARHALYSSDEFACGWWRSGRGPTLLRGRGTMGKDLPEVLLNPDDRALIPV